MKKILPYALWGGGILGGGLWAVNQGAEETAEKERNAAQNRKELIEKQKKQTSFLVKEFLKTGETELIAGDDTLKFERDTMELNGTYKVGVKTPASFELYTFDGGNFEMESGTVVLREGQAVDAEYGKDAEALWGIPVRDKVGKAIVAANAREFNQSQ